MPDPFGITQVDIPGIYGAVQNAHMGRIQQMLGQRQIQAADLQANRDNAIQGIIAKAYAAPRPAPAASAGATMPAAAATPPPPTTGAMPAVTPAGLPGADPAGTQQSARIAPEMAQQLAAQGPQGIAMIHTINAMSDEQLASAQHRLQALAPLYANVAHIPYQAPGTQPGAARRAFIQSVLPQIQQMGIDPAEATNFDPTDANLNAHMSFGQTMSEAMDSANAHPTLLHPGDVAVDFNAPPDANGQPHFLGQSPLVPGTQGATYPRPQNMDMSLPHPRTQQERDNLPAGQVYIAPDGTVHTATGPANAGGAPQPNAAGTFRQDGGAFDFNVHPTNR